ncbi:MerR family transcriptional regulator [Paenibacillus sp. J2TS4]|uniref:MerR family transcriptional regulator n=1 Tax=Paenibacillus sp. J2TS4 TaxID=2807194 RepID=UPI001B060CAF|nr:MerR family transcriptional regulator [Paenibacillus sp. J2TS4]GIP36130.1 MerR family transcriptional regulator [Paenibacillus sp. J2TS4]
MEYRSWKVGEIAKRTGITIRTLHHYDQIGLFSPSRVTESGHRLYTDEDVVRLHQILSLKQLGFALEEINGMINNPDCTAINMLKLQLIRINEQINQLVELRGRLEQIYELLYSGQTVSSERLMMVMQLMRIARSSHFMPAQAEGLETRFKSLEVDELEKSYAEGLQLVAEFRKYKEIGKPPSDPEVSLLAKRWKLYVDSFAPADEAFIQSAERYYSEYPEDAAQHGIDGELYEYIKQSVTLI